ncbi:hypothetical protein KKA47_04315 [bacterium]|nr:hypothetical protein [bacterium]
MLKKTNILSLFFVLTLLAGCSGLDQFTDYQRVEFDTIAVGESVSQTIEIVNNGNNDQHILGINFDPGSNDSGHFTMSSITVAGEPVEYSDLIVPAGESIYLTVKYAPQEFEETSASYGGWKTGTDTDVEDEEDSMIQRAIIILVYDEPRPGVLQVEVFGKALPGEIVPEPNEGVAKFSGEYIIDVPDLLPQPMALTSTGDFPISIEGEKATINMNDLPHLYIVKEEDWPDDPLPGMIFSIVISGVEGVTATGTFDGSKMEIPGLSFRVRGVPGKVTPDQITPGLQAVVDIKVENISLITTSEYTDGQISMQLKGRLPEKPSEHEVFNNFLGNREVIIDMSGTLSMPE